MTSETSAPLADGTRYGVLWVANLLPGVAMLAGLEVAYIFADRACTTGDMLPVHLTWALSLGLALLGAWLGWGQWRGVGGRHAGEEGGPEGRARFLSVLGMLTGAMASLAIAAQWSATFFFHPCQ
jgi:hypothetical protein